MIEREDLVEGEWYDGFMWKNNRQHGVACYRWTGTTFADSDGWCTNYRDENQAGGFEPNMISIGEPAS